MKERPTSPHLSVYKPMITSMSSILGRFAGIYLYLITSLLILLVAFNIQGKKNIGLILEGVLNFYRVGGVNAFLVIVFAFGSLFAFFLYLLAIVRHLIWDFGYLLDLKPSKIMGYGMFILSFLFALFTTIFMFFI